MSSVPLSCNNAQEFHFYKLYPLQFTSCMFFQCALTLQELSIDSTVKYSPLPFLSFVSKDMSTICLKSTLFLVAFFPQVAMATAGADFTASQDSSLGSFSDAGQSRGATDTPSSIMESESDEETIAFLDHGT